MPTPPTVRFAVPPRLAPVRQVPRSTDDTAPGDPDMDADQADSVADQEFDLDRELEEFDWEGFVVPEEQHVSGPGFSATCSNVAELVHHADTPAVTRADTPAVTPADSAIRAASVEEPHKPDGSESGSSIDEADYFDLDDLSGIGDEDAEAMLRDAVHAPPLPPARGTIRPRAAAVPRRGCAALQ